LTAGKNFHGPIRDQKEDPFYRFSVPPSFHTTKTQGGRWTSAVLLATTGTTRRHSVPVDFNLESISHPDCHRDHPGFGDGMVRAGSPLMLLVAKSNGCAHRGKTRT
jgi:hypothetical protein